MTLFIKNSRYFIAIISIVFAVNVIFAKNVYLVSSELSDSVTVTPSKPTSNDSLHFSLFNVAYCSCTKYFNQNISVSDSAITLFAQYNDNACKLGDCPKIGSTVSFSCGSLRPGSYKIFKQEDVYCVPGQPCGLVATQNQKELVGEISVTGANLEKQLVSEAGKQKNAHSVLSYSSVGKMLTLRITKAQFVQVTAYIINGEKTKEFSSKKFLPAGIHPYKMNLERFASGVVVIHVKGENFSEVQMINLTK